jgi:hypothetical protein
MSRAGRKTADFGGKPTKFGSLDDAPEGLAAIAREIARKRGIDPDKEPK